MTQLNHDSTEVPTTLTGFLQATVKLGFFFATCNLQLYKKQKWEFTPPRPQLSFENGLIYVEI